jgi:flagellar hook-length control protein FliK
MAATAAAAAAAAATIQTQTSAEALLPAFAAVRQAASSTGGLDGNAASTLPLATALASVATRSNDTALPFHAELRAALGSSEFAPSLGTQLSVLVRDGIEHAQLKLNPAEMGPIEVRIRLDGSQAQVDFSASQAGTRQALQDAVPALASALRESGLTLTGGGVFDQPREPRGEARQQARQGTTGLSDTTRDNTSATAGLPRMPRARGVVDLYA